MNDQDEAPKPAQPAAPSQPPPSPAQPPSTLGLATLMWTIIGALVALAVGMATLFITQTESTRTDFRTVMSDLRNDLRATQDRTQGDIADLRNALTTLSKIEGQLEGLKTSIADTRTDIASLRKDLGTLNAASATTNAELSNIEGKLEGIEGIWHRPQSYGFPDRDQAADDIIKRILEKAGMSPSLIPEPNSSNNTPADPSKEPEE